MNPLSKLKTSSSNGALGQPSESVDALLVARMRLILAIAGVISVYLDPNSVGLSRHIPLSAVNAYALYSSVLMLIAIYWRPLLWSRMTHRADVAWYALLIGVSSGSNSIFYLFFYFSILVASFGWGYREGVAITLISAVVFVIFGGITAPHGGGFELNRFITRTAFLTVLGYMISYWGGWELTFKRRLALLRDINSLSGSRLGLDRTLGSALQLIRSHYGVESCVLLLQEPDSEQCTLRRVYAEDLHHAPARPMSPDAARPLLTLPERSLVYYNSPTRGPLSRSHYQVRLPTSDQRPEVKEEQLEGLANLLEAAAFASAPLMKQDRSWGRLFLTCSKPGRFSSSDLDFLLQYCDQLLAVTENIQMLEQLASIATERERRKISRDIHDSTMQPYIGLKLAIDALRRKVSAQDVLASDIESLSEMAAHTITDLRNLVWELKGRPAMASKDLPYAISMLAERYARFYSIQVSLDSRLEAEIPDVLASECVQIVNEGLSNVRRHTSAHEATVRIASDENHITLSIENPQDEGSTPPRFTPRSITERARALGGTAAVDLSPDGWTVVKIEVPLHRVQSS